MRSEERSFALARLEEMLSASIVKKGRFFTGLCGRCIRLNCLHTKFYLSPIHIQNLLEPWQLDDAEIPGQKIQQHVDAGCLDLQVELLPAGE